MSNHNAIGSTFSPSFGSAYDLDDDETENATIKATDQVDIDHVDIDIDIDALMADSASESTSIQEDNPVLAAIAGKMDDVASPAIVSMTAPKAIDRFVDGFDSLADYYQTLETVVADIKSQTREMGNFSQSLKNDAVKNAAIASQVVELKADNAELRRIAERQSASLEELEAELAKKTATLSTVLADFRKSATEAEHVRAKADAAVAEVENLKATNEQLGAQLVDRKAAYERAVSEVETLRASKSEAIEDLRHARQDTSDVKCKLAELEAEHEKLSAYQESLVGDHGKLTEERRQLRRKLAVVEADLSDKNSKLKRVNAINSELIGRLETEKFSMNRVQEAVLSEFAVAKQRLESQDVQVDTLNEKLEVAVQDRHEATETMRKNAVALEQSRRELSRANLAISELNLKHSSDRLTLDQLRDENIELRSRLAKAVSENEKLKNEGPAPVSQAADNDESDGAVIADMKTADTSVNGESAADLVKKFGQNTSFSTAYNFKSTNFDD